MIYILLGAFAALLLPFSPWVNFYIFMAIIFVPAPLWLIVEAIVERSKREDK